jgi:hypothetical protein
MRNFYEATSMRLAVSRHNPMENVITPAGLLDLVEKAVGRFPMIDKKDISFDTGSCNFRVDTEISFGVSCSLYFRVGQYDAGSERHVYRIYKDGNATDEFCAMREMEYSFQLSSASTMRNLTNAAAMLRLEQEMLDLGNYIQAALGQYTIGIVYSLSKEEEEELAALTNRDLR